MYQDKTHRHRVYPAMRRSSDTQNYTIDLNLIKKILHLVQVTANPFPFLSFPSQRGTLSGTRSGRKTVDSTLQAPSAPLPAPAAAGSESNAVHGSITAASHGRRRSRSRPIGQEKQKPRRGQAGEQGQMQPNRTRLGLDPKPNKEEETARRGAARRLLPLLAFVAALRSPQASSSSSAALS